MGPSPLLEVGLGLVRRERTGRAGRTSKHPVCLGQLLKAKDESRREGRGRKEWTQTEAEEGRSP